MSAETVASGIKVDIEAMHAEIAPLTFGSKHTKTSDDLSSAMTEVLPRIETLSSLPGPGSVKLAYKLALLAFERSFNKEGASGYGERGSFDATADVLLEKLAKQRRKNEPEWDYRSDVMRMNNHSEEAQAFGVGENWYERTLDTMERWVQEDENPPVGEPQVDSTIDSDARSDY